MRGVVQRVARAEVRVDGRTVGSIGPGMLVFVGVGDGDTADQADWLAGKLSRLRIFEDDEGRMNRSVVDVGGAVLVVSQFTLLADTSRGNRPSFIGAAAPNAAEPLVGRVASALRALGLEVAMGEFGAHMEVDLLNDGPVTIVLESG
jgi:D-tyrosyl-tRNA(Tyr) deacylase